MNSWSPLCSARFLALFLVLCCLSQARAQYVNVAAEIELIQWYPRSAKPYLSSVRCVVGTNAWQMDGDFSSNSQTTYYFTGTNIIEHSVVTKLLRELGVYAAPIGAEVNRVSESIDGNPGTLSACGPNGRRLDVGPDRLCELGRIAWLAFCSGPCLKREGRLIFPPRDEWKELICAPSGFSDRTEVFDDTLGLPKSVDLYTSSNQPVFQYRVTSSTNILGREFPLEFYLAQYRPAYLPDSKYFGTNGWELQLTAKGKVTSIGLGTKLQNPPEAPTR
jgi:hypothetical protein